MITNEDYYPILLPDICRNIQYILRKYNDQFTITHVDESKCIIDAAVNIMAERAVLAGIEDPFEVTFESVMSFVPLITTDEQGSNIYVASEFAIPTGLDNIMKLLDMIIYKYKVNEFLDRRSGFLIHNINIQKKLGMSYHIHVMIDEKGLRKFVEMLTRYYSEIALETKSENEIRKVAKQAVTQYAREEYRQ